MRFVIEADHLSEPSHLQVADMIAYVNWMFATGKLEEDNVAIITVSSEECRMTTAFRAPGRATQIHTETFHWDPDNPWTPEPAPGVLSPTIHWYNN